MGTITKSTKPGGGTDINSGETGVPSDVNTDMNTVFTVINGNLDNDNLAAGANIAGSKIDLSSITTLANANIDSSAAIAPEKIDDHSADADEMAETRDPGETGNVTLSTDLRHELQSLRYMVRLLASGVDADVVDGTNATRWHDGPARPGNLLLNPSPGVAFGNHTSGVPDYWAAVGSPSTLATVALTEADGQGDGNAVRCVDGTGGTGFSQTLDGLKAGAKYLVVAIVKPDVDVVSLQTTGADSGTSFDDLDIDSTSASGSFETLAGIIQTDSTPTNIVVRLVGSDATSDWDTARVGVYEISDNPTPRPGYVCVRDTSTSTQNGVTTTAAVSGLSAAVTVPGPGYIIKVQANTNWECDGTGADGRARIRENGTPVGVSYNDRPDSVDEHSYLPTWVNTSPTPGTTYTYTVEVEFSAGNSHMTGAADGSELVVELIHAGGGA